MSEEARHQRCGHVIWGCCRSGVRVEMKILAALRKRRGLRRYARELPRCLVHDYGARKSFTPAQIEVAVRKLKLDATLIVYAYAMLLSREDFNTIPSGSPTSPTYEDARAEFIQYATHGTSSSEFHESELGLPAAGGWDSVFGGHDGGSL
jgi:hypothetical protein